MIDDFLEACVEARGKDLIIIRGLINSFSQCLAAPIYGVSGRVEATICLVLPIDVAGEQRAVLEAELIASGRKLSVRS